MAEAGVQNKDAHPSQIRPSSAHGKLTKYSTVIIKISKIFYFSTLLIIILLSDSSKLAIQSTLRPPEVHTFYRNVTICIVRMEDDDVM